MNWKCFCRYEKQVAVSGGVGVVIGGALVLLVLGSQTAEAPVVTDVVEEPNEAVATTSEVVATSTATTTAIEVAEPVSDEQLVVVPDSVVVPATVSPVTNTPPPVVEPAAEPVIVVEPTTPPIVEAVVATAAHQATLLTEHNVARAAVGVGPLTWSPTVAASAQSWADTLGRTRGCKMQHSQETGYGENLAWAWTSQNSAPLDPADAVRRWVDEQADYDYDTNSCVAGAVCGHYTQVVWADSTQVGCGVAVCTDDGFAQVWVCQYNPPGNWVGEQPY